MDGNVDIGIGALATRQQGVVSRAQLVARGLTHHQIEARLRSGRLLSVHRGVYAVGHLALPPRGRWMAAVLACGPGAVLSDTSAGAAWGLRGTTAPTIHVTVPKTTGRSRRPGIGLHRRHLADDETPLDGIPITTPARTLLDLARTLTEPQLARALEQAEKLRLDAHLTSTIERHRGRPGAPALAALLRRHDHDATTRSDLEAAFIALCHAHDLPIPGTNVHVEGFEVDAHWPTHRLVAELDSFGHHRTRDAFERDRTRDQVLQAAGYRVVRLTHRRLVEAHGEVAATLRRLTA